ncbi:MAG: excinuclease ABC subunit UvrA [Candidatus Omnitrophota bacterium]
MPKDYIIVKGAKEHNLKGIDLKIPRGTLTVITGLSGSGKSSLAFDTIYAEGQRRYVESLSAYARQFLEQLQKPNVEYIEGLSPAISIEQRSIGANPRSTVGTMTEIYDYLRLLFARVGRPHCYKCGKPITQQSSQEIVEKILELPAQTKIQILAPLVRGRKGEYREIFAEAKKNGFLRVRVDGKVYELDKDLKLDKKRKHDIEVLVDRISITPDVKRRLVDSVEAALRAGSGTVIISAETQLPDGFEVCGSRFAAKGRGPKTAHRTPHTDILFSELYACSQCGVSLPELEPRIFSFNSPYGACPACDGLGTKLEIDSDFVIPDKNRTLREGALEPWRRGGHGYIMYYRGLLRELADHFNFSMDVPYKELSQRIRNIILHGSEEHIWGKPYEGVIPHLERLFRETDSDYLKTEVSKYMSLLACPKCKGARLKPETLAVEIGGKNISEVTQFSIAKALEFFVGLKLTTKEEMISHQILKEINNRLKFMTNVGLEYLTLERASSSLSGGEAQRIRLATQVGAGLVGVLYVLDEPSIGLHQRDNSKLLDTLKALRDLGNTLLVVEHDEMTIRSADYIIDLGPGAGKHGGEIVACGTLDDILQCENSLTGKYLNGKLEIKIPKYRRDYKNRNNIEIKGAAEHNLKSIDVKIPLGVFACVAGVSGSGKSTLIDEILYRALAQKLYGSKIKPGRHERILGVENIDKVIVIDQSPIGRTPRSNPATYTGVFGHIRDLFAMLPDAKIRGYKPGRFSFNVKGGRCESCQGDGIKKIEMHFLPAVYVPCEVCHGKRYNAQTLEVKYKGRSISEVLEMTVEEALDLFSNIPKIKDKLQTLNDVGLSYIELGQSATTLSGGEAQRVKLSAELSKRATGKTLYILDEPTTGLHFADIDRLLGVLQALVDMGNSVVVIEHNLEVVKQSDYVIDLGPEGGDTGGYIVATGSPEEITENPRSYTGAYLKKVLKNTKNNVKI